MLELLNNPGTIAIVITAVFTILSLVAINAVKRVQVFIGIAGEEVATALKESADPLTCFKRAAADGRFTETEVNEFIKEINEARGAWAGVFAAFKATKSE